MGIALPGDSTGRAARDPSDQTPGPNDGETASLPLAERPCPSCTAFLDQLDGAAEHSGQHLNLAVEPGRSSRTGTCSI
ncbi:MAG: hypothetical protein ACXVVQ_02410 [Solirubrobacteraceae bacterium]